MADFKSLSQKRSFLIALFILSVLSAIFIVEIAYRIYLSTLEQKRFAYEYRLSDTAHYKFNRDHGQEFHPNSKAHFSKIKNGRVVHCQGVVMASNADGLDGITTIEQYNAADFKMLTFGDSFTHYYRDGLTIPDVVERELTDKMNVSVKNLNYGRGTYGLLQMVKLAAEKTAHHAPDLVVIQFIMDDLSRARWWSQGRIDSDGQQRALISSEPDGFENACITADEFIIHPDATAKWCKTLKREKNQTQDPTLHAANRYYKKALTQKRDCIYDTLSVSRLFVFERLGVLDPPRKIMAAIPRIKYDDYSLDDEFMEDLQLLKSSAKNILLINIPVFEEWKRGTNFGRNQREVGLYRSLKKEFGRPIITLFDLLDQIPMPPRIDQRPHDPHPNAAGVEFLGKLIAEKIYRNWLGLSNTAS